MKKQLGALAAITTVAGGAAIYGISDALFKALIGIGRGLTAYRLDFLPAFTVCAAVNLVAGSTAYL